MARKQSELAVITKAKDLGNYIFTITEKSPKKFRFTFVSRLQNLILSVIENLYRANLVYVRSKGNEEKTKKRKQYQQDAYTDLKVLGYMALLAREHQCILPKQYEQIGKQAAEVNQLLMAWVRSDQKRYNG